MNPPATSACLFLDDRRFPSSSSLTAAAAACLRSTLLHLCAGSCSGLKIGRPSMACDQIVDNVMAAIEGAMAHVPKRWANVRLLHVKAVNSAAHPIYQAVLDWA